MSYDYYEHKFKLWGKWANPRLEMDYPCVTTSIPVLPEKSYIEGTIGDDEAMVIHDCLIKMRLFKPLLYDVFIMTYAYRMPRFNEYDENHKLVRRGICETLEINKDKYNALKNEAKSALSLSLVCLNNRHTLHRIEPKTLLVALLFCNLLFQYAYLFRHKFRLSH